MASCCPAVPEAATAAATAATAVAATAPAASAVRLSRLAGWPTPAMAPGSGRRRDLCLRVPSM